MAWAEAMHEATWAAQLSGRIRPAACAQLLAVARLADTDLSAVELAGWAWNSVSALVAGAPSMTCLHARHLEPF